MILLIYGFQWNLTERAISSDNGNIVLLMYHGIYESWENEEPWQLFRLKDDFENDMKAIRDSGVSVKSYNEVLQILENGENITEPTIIIQFDDGLLSDYEYAFPTLIKYDLKATFFITSGRADGPLDGYMSWDQIREIYNYKNNNGEQLFEIGGHGETHTRLEKQEEENFDEWVNRMEYELKVPQEKIEANLGFKTNLFALPFGSGFNTEELNQLAEEFGYDLMRGWKTNEGNFTNVDPENIVAVPVYNNTNIQSAIKAAKNQN